MSKIVFSLLSDGSSDRVLLRYLTWIFEQHIATNTILQEEWADLRSLSVDKSSLCARISAALEYYPCDILFVHRDSEGVTYARRLVEIEQAGEACATLDNHLIPVIPVRMLEAWLLFDEAAIRSAAGNPNGHQSLNLPSLHSLESLNNPKSVLHEALRNASGLSGRRLKKLNVGRAVSRVADYIEDFSPLHGLPAYQKLESFIRLALGEM